VKIGKSALKTEKSLDEEQPIMSTDKIRLLLPFLQRKKKSMLWETLEQMAQFRAETASGWTH
jgi:hypothetical protein